MADAYLYAGTGRADLTPAPDAPSGMWMAQTHVRASGIHQALWVTALALRQGDQMVLLLDLDWTVLSDRQVRALRDAVHAATGVDHERILPFCTHNHAGPVTQDVYRGEGADEVHAYVAAMPAIVADAAVQATRALEPVRVAVGEGTSHVGVNRNLLLDDGRVVAGPNPDGPSDPTVGVVRIERFDGSVVAILVNYACHPTVLGPANDLVSPDYPGSTKRVVEHHLGGRCLFLQGAAGDVGPVEGFVGDVRVAERLGTLLGLEAARVALDLDARPVRRELSHVIASGAPLTAYRDVPTGAPEPRLAFASGTAWLPVRSPLPDVMGGAAKRAAEGERRLDRLRAEGADATELAEANQILERERLRADRTAHYLAHDPYPVEIAVLSIGPATLACSWGEPYAAIGRAVREASPLPGTSFVGYLGGDPLYVVPAGAYGPPTPFQVDNCPFREDAAGTLHEALLALLHDVASRSSTEPAPEHAP